MSILGLLKHEDVHRCIYHTRFHGLDLIPGNDYLANEKIEDHIFVKQLSQLKERYDYILIDTSPYFNKLIAEIMRAHDLVIIPTEINDDSIRGTMTTINEITQLVKEHQLPVIFTEVNGSDATANAISRETGCQVAQLTMLMDGPEEGTLSDYYTVLADNVTAVVNGFAGEEVIR